MKIKKVFCWLPNYCQGTLCWLRFVWRVYNDNGTIQDFPYDPRDDQAQKNWLKENS